MSAKKQSLMKLSKFEQAEVAALKGSTVLVCSSNRVFLNYYRSLSFVLGFTPVTAATPVAARAILRLMIVSFVVADGDEGLESCGHLLNHAREIQPQTPVVVVSTRLSQDFHRQVESRGAADYLHHPVLPDDMVRALLSGTHAKQSVRSSSSERMTLAKAASGLAVRTR